MNRVFLVYKGLHDAGQDIFQPASSSEENVPEEAIPIVTGGEDHDVNIRGKRDKVKSVSDFHF